MTVIVADAVARIMVSDTQVTDDKEIVCYNALKVVRCKDGSLAGASGGGVACVKFLKWAKNGRRGKLTIDDFNGLILTAAGKILLFDGSKHADEALDTCAAVGAGAPLAMAAMFVGADAVKAVEAAIKFSTVCGGRVVVDHL